jgi:hypothetical protein
MSMLTLLDIAKRNASDAVAGLLDEVSRQVPEVSGMVRDRGQMITVPNMAAARTISGIQYKTLVRTGLPTVAFRTANNGSDPSKSTVENRLVECFILDCLWQADKAVADAHEDGAAALIAEEAQAILSAAFMTLGKQFYYGATADPLGHPGLLQAVQSEYVVDATGNEAGTGSSVYAVKFGPQDVQWVMGNDGQLNVSDVRIERVLGENSKSMEAYVQSLVSWVGVQTKSRHAVGRIKNLTRQSGKTLTDEMLGDLISRFPVGNEPDALFMTKRSREQLRKSRTATTATGAPAATPTDFEGIPIIPTDSILNTEAIA